MKYLLNARRPFYEDLNLRFKGKYAEAQSITIANKSVWYYLIILGDA